MFHAIRHAACFIVLAAILCAIPRACAGDALLDEVVAGVDANLTLITSGRAVYDVPRKIFVVKHAAGEQRLTVRTVFLDQMVRWQNDDYYALWDGDDSYSWAPTIPDDPPYRTNIIQRPQAEVASRPWRFHPRTLGHSIEAIRDEIYSLSDYIRKMDTPPENESIQITAERDGPLIKVTFRIRPEKYPELRNESLKHWRRECWVDPQQGYGIVHYKRWGGPQWPYHDAETRYRQADNGAWVAEHYAVHTRERVFGDDNRVVGIEEDDTVIELQHLDLTTPVDPEEFTLAAMDVPKGARIQDRRENREYFYQVAAVTEEEIEAEWLRQNQEHAAAIRAERESRRRWTIYGIIGGIVAVVGLIVVYRLRAA